MGRKKHTMTKLKKLKIFPLKNEDEFENLCLSLWKRILGDPNVQLNGRRGQRQHGVDLFGRRAETLNWIGVQCKVRNEGILTKSEIISDVEKAKHFNPRLSELVIATTAKRDEKVQALARTLTEMNIKNGSFAVHIFSWDDIQSELSEESNLDICRKFYEDFFINYEDLGIAISRILRVSIGVGHSADTSYELLLGKTPSPVIANSFYGLNYWKGNHFIANWNERTIDTFPSPTFPSDLERVFRSKRDAYIVAKWLNDTKSVDALIYGENEEHVELISKEEYHNFLVSLKD